MQADTDLPQSLLFILPQCIGEIDERGLDVKVCMILLNAHTTTTTTTSTTTVMVVDNFSVYCRDLINEHGLSKIVLPADVRCLCLSVSGYISWVCECVLYPVYTMKLTRRAGSTSARRALVVRS